MEKIPTAKEFCEKKFKEINPATSWIDFNKEVMIEFAKFHVEAALKEAGEKAYAKSTSSSITSKTNLTCIHLGDVFVDKPSILNSYPLENIK